MEETLVGQTIDGFEVRVLLGRGGMGEVYKAQDTRLDRPVALKVLSEHESRDREFALRFEREARAASGLNHPNIAHIYATGRLGQRPYYVMEYVEGRSLGDVLAKHGRLGGPKSLDYLRQAAEGLRAAWEQRIVHRDIKPDNLMVDARDQLKIVDFGLARRPSDDVAITHTSMVVGTPRYMSPEQATAGTVDHRSDIYSLGATFYHLIAGEAPFDAPTPVATMMKHVNEPLTPLRLKQPSVPMAVANIVERMLAKRPEDRYATYDALLADVAAARTAPARAPGATLPVPPPATPVSRFQVTPQEEPKSPMVPLLIAVVIALVVAVLVLMNRSPGPGASADEGDTQKVTDKSRPEELPGMFGVIGMALHTRSLAHVRKLATAIEVYMAENEALPETLDPIVARYEVPPEELRDGWAHPIRYERLAAFKYRLSSAGADARFGSGDDIVLENGRLLKGELRMPGMPTGPQMRGEEPPPRPVTGDGPARVPVEEPTVPLPAQPEPAYHGTDAQPIVGEQR